MMISGKLVALMAAIAFIATGVGGLTGPTTAAFADYYEKDGKNDKNGNNNFEVDIERNNEIEQEQEACTNEVEVEAGGDQIALVNADQNNECEVDQNQEAVIVDFSENAFDIAGLLVS